MGIYLDSLLRKQLRVFELRRMKNGAFVRVLVGDIGYVRLAGADTSSLDKMFADDRLLAVGSFQLDSPSLLLFVIRRGQNVC